jgi:hypothetical protein
MATAQFVPSCGAKSELAFGAELRVVRSGIQFANSRSELGDGAVNCLKVTSV